MACPARGDNIATGIFITDRVNKMPLVLAFLGIHFLLFTIAAYVSDPTPVVEIFIAPDLHMALFFAFFILTDPPTSPAGCRQRRKRKRTESRPAIPSACRWRRTPS